MMRLGSQDGPTLRVVDDQVGNPTSTATVARVIECVLDAGAVGTFHATCEGETTWYGLTQSIFDHMSYTRELVPCTTEEFPRPAPRPKNSRLHNRALKLAGLPDCPHWQDDLHAFLESGPSHEPRRR
jgi:dTDP-4-dehydrorhamnose reductase